LQLAVICRIIKQLANFKKSLYKGLKTFYLISLNEAAKVNLYNVCDKLLFVDSNISYVGNNKTKGIFSISSCALLVSLIYFFSITLIPIISSYSAIFSNHNNIVKLALTKNTISQQKNLNFLLHNFGHNNVEQTTTVTYISNGQMLSRQIGNNNLQSYISDTKGSVLKLNSNDIEQNQTYSYGAYGKLIASKIKRAHAASINSIINPFLYNNERYDGDTELQYLRARFYNPDIKRFINQDSYDLLNKFNYVDGNPVMAADPNGHQASSAEYLSWMLGKIFRTGENTLISPIARQVTNRLVGAKDLHIFMDLDQSILAVLPEKTPGTYIIKKNDLRGDRYVIPNKEAISRFKILKKRNDGAIFHVLTTGNWNKTDLLNFSSENFGDGFIIINNIHNIENIRENTFGPSWLGGKSRYVSYLRKTGVISASAITVMFDDKIVQRMFFKNSIRANFNPGKASVEENFFQARCALYTTCMFFAAASISTSVLLLGVFTDVFQRAAEKRIS